MMQTPGTTIFYLPVHNGVISPVALERMRRGEEGFTVDCEPVRGPGSWVRLALPDLKIIRAAEQARAQLAQLPDGEIQQAIDDYNDRFIAARILDWNWVGSDGKRLPLPSQDASVLDNLSQTEYAFLYGLWG